MLAMNRCQLSSPKHQPGSCFITETPSHSSVFTLEVVPVNCDLRKKYDCVLPYRTSTSNTETVSKRSQCL